MSRRTSEHLLAQARIGPGITVERGLHGGKCAVTPRPDADSNNGRMPFWVYEQAFLPRVQHLDRTPGLFSEQCNVNLSRNILFAAEATAGQRRHDPDGIGLHAQRGRSIAWDTRRILPDNQLSPASPER